MKKRTIVASIIAGVFLIAGAICCVVAMDMVQFHFSELGSNELYSEHQYEVFATDIEMLLIEDKNNEIAISYSMDDKIRITYYENTRESYEIAEKDGVLSVKYNDTKKWYEHIGINWGFPQRKMTVELPYPYGGSLTVETSNGKISLSNVDFPEGSVKLHTSNASIYLDRNSIAGDLRVETSNGRIITEEVGAKGKISLQSSNGRIDLDITEVGSGLTCKTSNGSITGTVPGDMEDYTITADTSNGKCNLPESYQGNGGKTLSAETSNGSIDIDFE